MHSSGASEGPVLLNEGARRVGRALVRPAPGGPTGDHPTLYFVAYSLHFVDSVYFVDLFEIYKTNAALEISGIQ